MSRLPCGARLAVFTLKLAISITLPILFSRLYLKDE